MIISFIFYGSQKDLPTQYFWIPFIYFFGVLWFHLCYFCWNLPEKNLFNLKLLKQSYTYLFSCHNLWTCPRCCSMLGMSDYIRSLTFVFVMFPFYFSFFIHYYLIISFLLHFVISIFLLLM